jgi:hypothetical protein
MIRLLDMHGPNVSQPYYTLKEHTLAVTDMYIGFGRTSVRLATVSLDRTCKASKRRYLKKKKSVKFYVLVFVDLGCVK